MVVEPTGSETQVVAHIGTQNIIAVFRERHQFNPGDKIHLKPRSTSCICSTRHRPALESRNKLDTNANKSLKQGERNDE